MTDFGEDAGYTPLDELMRRAQERLAKKRAEEEKAEEEIARKAGIRHGPFKPETIRSVVKP